MPELPDVEGYRRELARRLPGRRVQHVHVLDDGVLRNVGTRSLRARLTRRTFTTPRRHGKWLILPTDGPILLVHSGMTGRPYYAPSTAEHERFERVVVELDQGELRYVDLRKLRGLWLAADASACADVIGPTGPDALDIAADEFAFALDRPRRLKAAFLDQAVIAGLGNLLVDEICWQARVNPHRTCASLDAEEVHRMLITMRRVLRTSVRHGRVPALRGWLTRVRDDVNARCPRCHGPLDRDRVNGRTTVWCPREQRDRPDNVSRA